MANPIKYNALVFFLFSLLAVEGKPVHAKTVLVLKGGLAGCTNQGDRTKKLYCNAQLHGKALYDQVFNSLKNAGKLMTPGKERKQKFYVKLQLDELGHITVVPAEILLRLSFSDDYVLKSNFFIKLSEKAVKKCQRLTEQMIHDLVKMALSEAVKNSYPEIVDYLRTEMGFGVQETDVDIAPFSVL